MPRANDKRRPGGDGTEIEPSNLKWGELRRYCIGEVKPISRIDKRRHWQSKNDFRGQRSGSDMATLSEMAHGTGHAAAAERDSVSTAREDRQTA